MTVRYRLEIWWIVYLYPEINRENVWWGSVSRAFVSEEFSVVSGQNWILEIKYINNSCAELNT